MPARSACLALAAAVLVAVSTVAVSQVHAPPAPSASKPPIPAPDPRVTRCVAVDGDGFRCGKGPRYRLSHIYAPELSEPGGELAKGTLQAILDDPGVRIHPRRRDRWGRVLVDLYVNEQRIRQRHISPRGGRASEH